MTKKQRIDHTALDFQPLDAAFLHGKYAGAYKAAYREVFGDEPWYEQYRCVNCPANDGEDLQFPLYLKERDVVTCIRPLPDDMTCTACGVGELVPFWPDERIHSDILAELALPGACGFVAFYQGEIVGFTLGFCASPTYLEDHLRLSGLATVLEEHGTFEKIAYLSDMAVVPAFRGKGIARALFEKRQEALLQAKPDAQIFRTRPDTKTYAWYQSEFSFQIVDRYSRVRENDVRVILLYPHSHHKQEKQVSTERIVDMGVEQKRIDPDQPSGVIDYLPEEQIPRQRIIDVVRGVYERYGFDPLETPILERERVLTGGKDDFDMKLFKANVSGETYTYGNGTACRFDLTVPLARVVAANPDLPVPFKRYQYGHVFRGEKPQVDKGRYREFAQLDADIVGAESVLADAEVIMIMDEVMRSLGFGANEFVVRFNNRKLLNGLPLLIGFDPDYIIPFLRVIDKFEKVGRDEVLASLKKLEIMDGAELLDTIELGEAQLAKVAALLDIVSDDSYSALDQAAVLFAGIDVAEEGIRELRTICEALASTGILDVSVRIDLTIVRGLGYYTGPIFETTLLELPEIGSVYSGGRFDGLVSRFSDRKLPATGASVGVDRLLKGMLLLGKFETRPSNTQVLVLNLGDEYGAAYQALAAALRAEGLSVSVYYGSESRVGGQLGYADRLGASCAVILGKREFESGMLAVKDLAAKQQVSVPFRDSAGSVAYTELVQAVLQVVGSETSVDH